MPEIELTNMVMVQDRQTGKVLVLERVKKWPGLSFPGGHIEGNESIVDSAIREIREETGLSIRNLEPCGVVHWSNSGTFDRYFVFLFKTTDYSGDITEETDEGKVFWADIADIAPKRLAPNMEQYLPMFLEGRHFEAFGSWNDGEPWEIVYK